MKFDPASLPSAQLLSPEFKSKFAELTDRRAAINANFQETLRAVMQVNTDQIEALDAETKTLWDAINAAHSLGNGDGYAVETNSGVVAKISELQAHSDEVAAASEVGQTSNQAPTDVSEQTASTEAEASNAPDVSSVPVGSYGNVGAVAVSVDAGVGVVSSEASAEKEAVSSQPSVADDTAAASLGNADAEVQANAQTPASTVQ